MSGWLIGLTGLVYFYVSLEQMYKGNIGMAIAYFGYAFSNIGLYLLASKQECAMKEPVKFSMSNDRPVQDTVKKYPLPSIEQELWDTIQDHKNDRKNDQKKEKDQIA